jgi:hypothetical protein
MKKEEKSMKTKKVVIGAIAASMLSLSIGSLAPAIAAGETVQISVGTAEAKAGDKFTVDVSLADIPSDGIQGVDFAIEYDNKVISVKSVELSSKVSTNDESAALLQNYDLSLQDDKGYFSVIWTTSADKSYWVKQDGVFCTISGTVASDAKAGDKSDLKLVAVKRNVTPKSGTANDSIGIGYTTDDDVPVRYAVKTVNGKVSVPSETTATTTATTTVTTTVTTAPNKGVRGDANCDKDVNMADAVLIMQSLANPNKFGISGTDEKHITTQGLANADVVGNNDGVTNLDALQIQKYLLQLVTEL